ncbi:MAG: hypothetical protein HUU22_12080 [Phycisphaerae bacterium]|nr:hypothetical protein [Phycisphaerae bacterium]NUQ46755.1 hypothetical protein [Phycisphaerae bacterium]
MNTACAIHLNSSSDPSAIARYTAAAQRQGFRRMAWIVGDRMERPAVDWATLLDDLSRTARQSHGFHVIGASVRGAAPGVAAMGADASRSVAPLVDWLRVAAVARLAWLGVGSCAPCEPSPRGERDRPDERLHALREALLTLRFDAEDAGVTLALCVPDSRLRLDPTGARDFLDALATPWIRFVLDFDAIAKDDEPCEWVETLGARIEAMIVRVPARGGAADASGGENSDRLRRARDAVAAMRRSAPRECVVLDGGEAADYAIMARVAQEIAVLEQT